MLDAKKTPSIHPGISEEPFRRFITFGPCFVKVNIPPPRHFGGYTVLCFLACAFWPVLSGLCFLACAF
ncbi:MAG: hypothetical protein ACE5H3_07205, partial [Planctomycetota bacterium]